MGLVHIRMDGLPDDIDEVKQTLKYFFGILVLSQVVCHELKDKPKNYRCYTVLETQSDKVASATKQPNPELPLCPKIPVWCAMQWFNKDTIQESLKVFCMDDLGCMKPKLAKWVKKLKK